MRSTGLFALLVAACYGGRSSSVRYPELREYAADVDAGSLLGHEEHLGDGPIAGAFGEQVEHFPFARGQPIQRSPVHGFCRQGNSTSGSRATRLRLVVLRVHLMSIEPHLDQEFPALVTFPLR